MTRALLFILFLTGIWSTPAIASDLSDPLSPLRGAVREFFQIKTLGAKLERTQVSGVGRKKSTTFQLHYRKPDQMSLESLVPAGYFQAVSDQHVVAFNAGAKQGFAGALSDVPEDARERLWLIPGFALNPLIPINPRAYDLKAAPSGKTRVRVTMTPRAGGYSPLEIVFLKDPYRVASIRIEGDDWGTETEYTDWTEYDGIWMFGRMSTTRRQGRVQTQENVRVYEIRMNEALPAGWPPAKLPDGFEEIGREFFTVNGD